MAILHLDHVNICTARLRESLDFYGEVLGLSVATPPMAADTSKGAWCRDSRGVAVIHLVGTDTEGPTTELVRGTAQRGMIDHFALRCDDLQPVVAALSARQLAHEIFDVPQLGLRLLFVRDPNGVMVELGQPLAA